MGNGVGGGLVGCAIRLTDTSTRPATIASDLLFMIMVLFDEYFSGYRL
jgi:hypothetical protein